MQGTNHTVLGRYCVVTVPLHIQVSMIGLSVYCVLRVPSSFGVIRMSKKGMEPSSLIYDHFNITGHNVKDNLSIVGRRTRTSSEQSRKHYIRVNNPSLNSNRQTLCATYMG